MADAAVWALLPLARLVEKIEFIPGLSLVAITRASDEGGRWPVAIVGTDRRGLCRTRHERRRLEPSAFLAIGADSGAQRQYAERVLGHKVATRPDLGHDGRFFFILANDPFLLAATEHASFLDLPTYRAQRISIRSWLEA